MNTTSEFISVPDLAMNGLPPADSYRVRQAQIVETGLLAMLYDPKIHLVYERIVIDRPDPFYAPTGVTAQQAAIVAMLMRNANAPGSRIINLTHEGDTIPALRSAGGFKTRGDVPKGAVTLSFLVHIDEEAGPKADEGFKPKPDGIEIALIFRDANGAEIGRQLSTIDPSVDRDVRAPTKVSFELPTGIAQFDMEVSERTNGAYDSASFYDFEWAQ